MSPSDQPAPREITQDVPCPGCGYNLRGLAGDVVNCPECGQSCDVAKLIKWRWVGSWRRVPQLDTLAWPAVWLLLASLTIGGQMALTMRLFFALISGHPYGRTLLRFTIFCAAAILPVWMWLMYRAWRQWPGRQGLRLALLAHAVLLAYLAGAAPLVVACLAYASRGWLPLNHRAAILLAVAGPLVCAFSWWAAHRGYRYLGRQCIRRHLRGRT
jgi:hypothetical protein